MLSCDVLPVMKILAVLIEHGPVSDRQTDTGR